MDEENNLNLYSRNPKIFACGAHFPVEIRLFNTQIPKISRLRRIFPFKYVFLQGKTGTASKLFEDHDLGN